MRKLPLLILIAFTAIISGCLGPKMINKWVTKQYGESIDGLPKMKNDYLSITSGLTTNDQKPSSDTKQTKNFLPLLFYWQFDYLNTCMLNPKIPINTFSSTAQLYANTKGLKQKLNGQKIELSIDSVPNVFELNDRGHLIWVILYAFSWDVITFRPDSKDMVVSYKILKDNTETKKGVVTISNTGKIKQLKFLQSIKKATAIYLDEYDESIKAMSKKVVDKIITEL